MRSHYLLSVFWIVLTLNPPIRADEQVSRNAEASIVFLNSASTAVIPLSRSSGLFVVRAKIDHIGEGWFLIDTGCSYCLLDEKLTDGLALPDAHMAQYGTLITDSANSNLKAPKVGKFGQLVVGSVTWQNGLVIATDMSGLSDLVGLPLTGVIGGNVLQSAPITLDCVENTLTVYDPKHFKPSSGEAVSLRCTSNLPAVYATVEDHPGFFMLDTGNIGGVRLLTRFTYLNGFLDDRPQQLGFSIRGLASNTPVRRVQMSSIELAHRRLKNIWAVCEQRESASLWRDHVDAGDMPLDLMEGGRFTFDWINRKCWVEWLPQEPRDEALRRFEDPKSQDKHLTPLMRAVRAHRDDILGDLISRDPTAVEAQTQHHQTALMFAALDGNAVATRILLNQHADTTVVSDMEKSSAVIYAALSGSDETVQEFIKSHADLNVTNARGLTPLMIAASANSPSMIDALVAGGAKLESTDENGETALMCATFCGGHAAVVALINHGANPQVRDSSGATSLMIAAIHRDSESASLFLQKGVDVNAEMSDGCTALMFAAKFNDARMIRLLLSHGADISHRDKVGRNAANYAARDSSMASLDELVRNGCIPTSAN